MYSCSHWLRPSPPHAFGLRGRYWSAKIDNISLFGQVKLLGGQASRLQVNKLSRLLEAGTEEDDWREAVEAVRSAADLLAQA